MIIYLFISLNTMGPPANKKSTKTKAPMKKPEMELQAKNLNISAGRVIYERASSRQSRHRDILKNQKALPLKRSSSIMDRSKKRHVFVDHEEQEERMEQAGRRRFFKIAWTGRGPAASSIRSPIRVTANRETTARTLPNSLKVEKKSAKKKLKAKASPSAKKAYPSHTKAKSRKT